MGRLAGPECLPCQLRVGQAEQEQWPWQSVGYGSKFERGQWALVDWVGIYQEGRRGVVCLLHPVE